MGNVSITASKLRANIYQVLDQVAATGQPIDVLCNGQLLRIVAVQAGARPKLQRLSPRAGAFTGDLGELAELNWASSWKP